VLTRREALRALVALPSVARVQRAAVAPGDVIVFEADEALSDTQIQRIQETGRAVWPDNRIVVVDRGIHLRIIEGATRT
jgi:hypothetical protein